MGAEQGTWGEVSQVEVMPSGHPQIMVLCSDSRVALSPPVPMPPHTASLVICPPS